MPPAGATTHENIFTLFAFFVFFVFFAAEHFRSV